MQRALQRVVVRTYQINRQMSFLKHTNSFLHHQYPKCTRSFHISHTTMQHKYNSEERKKLEIEWTNAAQIISRTVDSNENLSEEAKIEYKQLLLNMQRSVYGLMKLTKAAKEVYAPQFNMLLPQIAILTRPMNILSSSMYLVDVCGTLNLVTTAEQIVQFVHEKLECPLDYKCYETIVRLLVQSNREKETLQFLKDCEEKHFLTSSRNITGYARVYTPLFRATSTRLFDLFNQNPKLRNLSQEQKAHLDLFFAVNEQISKANALQEVKKILHDNQSADYSEEFREKLHSFRDTAEVEKYSDELDRFVDHLDNAYEFEFGEEPPLEFDGPEYEDNPDFKKFAEVQAAAEEMSKSISPEPAQS